MHTKKRKVVKNQAEKEFCSLIKDFSVSDKKYTLYK